LAWIISKIFCIFLHFCWCFWNAICGGLAGKSVEIEDIVFYYVGKICKLIANGVNVALLQCLGGVVTAGCKFGVFLFDI